MWPQVQEAQLMIKEMQENKKQEGGEKE